jgi:hypothetical protein
MLLVRYGRRAYVLTHTTTNALYHVMYVLSSQHSTTVPLCWIRIYTSHTQHSTTVPLCWIRIYTSHTHAHTVPEHTCTG